MLDRLTRADQITGAGALLVIVATLLPWYHYDEGASRVTVNAFGVGFLGDVVFVCAVVAVGLVLGGSGLLGASGAPRRTGLMVAVGAAALFAAVLQVLVGVNGSGAFHGATFGLVLGLCCCGVMAAGGWLARQEDVDATPRRAGGFR